MNVVVVSVLLSFVCSSGELEGLLNRPKRLSLSMVVTYIDVAC